MELKKVYTRREADLLALVSSVIGSNPHTFQGQSAYWEAVELDFENSILNFDVEGSTPNNVYYALVGIASLHELKFEERF
jgi:hypothetical protein